MTWYFWGGEGLVYERLLSFTIIVTFCFCALSFLTMVAMVSRSPSRHDNPPTPLAGKKRNIPYRSAKGDEGELVFFEDVL